MVSQAICGANVKVLKSKRSWSLIQTDDDYQGWVSKDSLGKLATSAKSNFIEVTNNFAFVYREADDTLHAPLLMLPFGVQLPIIKIQDDRWIKVRLVGGGYGWIQQGDVSINAKPLSMTEMLALSPQFAYIPYLWGGTSTFGFDCSGFVQFLYRQIGIIIPRDANLQVIWPRFIEVTKENLQPGDIIYFGWNDVISHAGVYLGDYKFINSTAYKNPRVQISDLRTEHWKDIFIAARRLDVNWPEMRKFQSAIEPLSENMKQKMRAFTWQVACPVPLEDLAYLRLSHWGFDGKVHSGALIVHKKLAPEISDIFYELYQARFPIEKMTPIEEYRGDDERSMRENNTSAFNCRTMTDFNDRYSAHSYGSAIDINPLINPYANGKEIAPKSGSKYLDRNAYHKGKITLQSAAFRAFSKRGWFWGGSWPGNIKDYQHFEKMP